MWKSLLAVGLGVALGVSPFRDSVLADFLIAITGG